MENGDPSGFLNKTLYFSQQKKTGPCILSGAFMSSLDDQFPAPELSEQMGVVRTNQIIIKTLKNP